MISLIIRLIDTIVWPAVLVLAIWLVFFINTTFGLGLNQFGMHPHEIRGIYGVVSMVFLHANFDHLFSNSVPLLLGMGFIFIYFEQEKWHILLYNMLITGVLLIFIGKGGTNHIGASGLVYAYIFFLVTHAFLTRNKEMLAAAFILIFLYGSLVYGLFPEYGILIGKDISWEGHLSGAISGVLTGIAYRAKGPQQAMFFTEEEDDDDDEDGYWNLPDEPQEPEEPTVVYHYKEGE